jgi:DNA processing protein
MNTNATITREPWPARLARLGHPRLNGGAPATDAYVIGATLADATAGTVIAVVGARACSEYGRSVARSWATELAATGVTIVSGLARGVDAEAHRGTLDVGGVTVAVLGCGVDRPYPAGHAELYHRIIESGGSVVSEYKPGIEPAPWRFPARNRIIAGLADAVLVIEAREQSGALITADYALAAGVPVYAVPGEVGRETSAGSNALLRDGHARIATEPADVLRTLDLTRKA